MRIWRILCLIHVIICIFFLKTSEATKPTQPIDIEVFVSDTTELPQAIKITVKVTPRITGSPTNFKNATVKATRVEGESSILPEQINIPNIKAGKTEVIEFKVVPSLGQTDFSFDVEAFDFDHKILMGRGRHLYLSWDGKELFSGNASFMSLALDKSKKHLDEGLISQEQYKCEVQKAICGGPGCDRIKNMDCSEILKMLEESRKYQEASQKN